MRQMVTGHILPYGPIVHHKTRRPQMHVQQSTSAKDLCQATYQRWTWLGSRKGKLTLEALVREKSSYQKKEMDFMINM